MRQHFVQVTDVQLYQHACKCERVRQTNRGTNARSPAHIKYPRLPTCPEPRHRRRGVSVIRVARPQLSVAVCAPAINASAGQHNARVVVSRGDCEDP